MLRLGMSPHEDFIHSGGIKDIEEETHKRLSPVSSVPSARGSSCLDFGSYTRAGIP